MNNMSDIEYVMTAICIILGFVAGWLAGKDFEKSQPKEPEDLHITELSVTHLKPGDMMIWSPVQTLKRMNPTTRSRYIRGMMKRIKAVLPKDAKVLYLAPGDKLEILKANNAKSRL